MDPCLLYDIAAEQYSALYFFVFFELSALFRWLVSRNMLAVAGDGSHTYGYLEQVYGDMGIELGRDSMRICG
jgi:hypothetical protein